MIIQVTEKEAYNMKKFTVLVSALVLFSTPVLAGTYIAPAGDKEPTGLTEEQKKCDAFCVAAALLVLGLGGGGGAEGTGTGGSNGVGGSNGTGGT